MARTRGRPRILHRPVYEPEPLMSWEELPVICNCGDLARLRRPYYAGTENHVYKTRPHENGYQGADEDIVCSSGRFPVPGVQVGHRIG